MKYDICIKKRYGFEYDYIVNKLPSKIGTGILEFLENNPYSSLNEIRIHKNSPLTLIADFQNIKTSIITDGEDLENTMKSLCDGSVYAHYPTIKDGYISVGKGIRAGVCGRAVCEKDEITSICEINSINIRIPKRIYNASDKVFNVLKNENFKVSILIYSPPGVGKTTILRDLICRLSELEPPKRVSVIDTREEITPCIQNIINSDVFISYPKGKAIELATKSMTPEIIICDEISSEKEAEEILKSMHCGVNLIATAHAKNFEDLKSRTILRTLISSGVFDYAIGINRKNGSNKYEYSLNNLNHYTSQVITSAKENQLQQQQTHKFTLEFMDEKK